jgi:hypothetical protein
MLDSRLMTFGRRAEARGDTRTRCGRKAVSEFIRIAIRPCGFLVAATLVASAPATNQLGQFDQRAGVARLSTGPLVTGVLDGTFGGADADLAFRRTADAGSATVRLPVAWSGVAPQVRGPGFRPDNPADPAYRWGPLDRQVKLAISHGLSPIVGISSSPAWAEGGGQGRPGTVKPDPAELGAFSTAVARRYSGTFGGLPRVRYWQVWNEPNLIFYLEPQYVGTRTFSPVWYRAMVNAFSDAVHSVHRDNVVIAGGLAPFTTHTGDRREWGLAPLHFMRDMLCMSKNLTPKCKARARFDVWAHHPYTSGGPNHHAHLADDVSLGDLPQMRRLLDAAIRAGHVVNRMPVRFWVTEFSWDTSPPDPKGVPARTHARWVAEALYRMWSNGISLVTWFQLRDDPLSASLYQSGLYFRGPTIEQDRPKPALRAFRFPFVALPEGNGARVWGRTPTSRRGNVIIQLKAGSRWLPLAVLRADRYGIFRRHIRVLRGAAVRARFAPTRETALAFRVMKTKDRPRFAFGTPPP